MTPFTSPWSRSLVLISALASTVLMGGATISWIVGPKFLAPLLGGIPVAAALFTIRGYSISSGTLFIHRLFWRTSIPLAGLKSAEHCPDALNGAIRTIGNGGLYSFSGYFRSKDLGPFRAFVTDLHSTVVMRFPTHVIVVSPGAPDDFIQQVGNA